MMPWETLYARRGTWIWLAALVCAVLISLPFGLRVFAQNQELPQINLTTQDYRPSAVVHVQRNEVSVHVVVRDSHGAPVGGLQKSDFELYDDGKLQDVADFALEEVKATAAQAVAPNVAVAPPPPRYVAMFFDDRDMTTENLTAARKAAEKFITQALASGDRVGIFTASGLVRLDYTSDMKALVGTLGHLEPHLWVPEDRLACPQMDVYQAFMIFQFNDNDALQLAMARANVCCPNCQPEGVLDMVKETARRTLGLAEQYGQGIFASIEATIQSLARTPGRRVLVLASSGFWTGTLQQQQSELVDEALRANVTINSLDAKGLFTQTPGTGVDEHQPETAGITSGNPRLGQSADEYTNSQHLENNDVMAGLAESTGGQFFHNSNDVGEGMVRIAAVPEVSYTLGFSPGKPDDHMHKLTVKLAQKEPYSIESRQGYFAAIPKTSKTAELAEKMNQEALSDAKLNELPVEVKTQTGKLDTGATGARVMVHIDVTDIPFKKEHGRRVDDVLWATVLLNDKGEVADGRLSTINMALKDDMFSTLSQKGINAHLDLNVPPGKYRLREVVGEAEGGKMFATNETVTVQ